MKAVQYLHQVIWNDSLRAASSATGGGDATAERTEEEIPHENALR